MDLISITKFIVKLIVRHELDIGLHLSNRWIADSNSILSNWIRLLLLVVAYLVGCLVFLADVS